MKKLVAVLVSSVLAAAGGVTCSRGQHAQSSWPLDPVEAAAIHGLVAEQAETQARWQTTYEAIRAQARKRLGAPVDLDGRHGLWVVPETATVTSGVAAVSSQ